jgi:pimeloyl-ACP methyl ester carboxylesterase
MFLAVQAMALASLLACSDKAQEPPKTSQTTKSEAPAAQPAQSSQAETRSGFAILDGVGGAGGAKVQYLDTGTVGQGTEAVVFIHGWACDASFWRLQAPALKGRRAIYLDLPGHGRSDKPDVAYTQELFARSVDAVLRDARVDKAVLVGHSMGFPVARVFARLFPAKVKGLVCVDGALLRIPAEGDEAEEFKEEFAELVASLRSPEYKDAINLFIEPMFVDETPPPVRQEIKDKMLAVDQRVAASAMQGFGDPAVWDEAPVGVPVLAVYAQSPYLEEDHEQYLRRLFPDLQYKEIDGVGHFLMLEKPEEFNGLLGGFLDRLGSK